MKNALLKLHVSLQTLMMQEEGQDLVEYALVLALVSVLAVTALTTLSTSITSVFTNINGKL
jgi:pilus assembly protein Flp/PilA